MRDGAYLYPRGSTLVWMLHYFLVEVFNDGLIGDDEVIESLHVLLLGTRQCVVGQILDHLRDEDQLPLRDLLFEQDEIMSYSGRS